MLMRGGAYTWSNTSVKEKVGLSVDGPIRGGGGGGWLIGGEIRYVKIILQVQLRSMT